MKYDIIVVGGGHAGCEAAAIAAKSGKKTALITNNILNIGDMACNPSIGGSAKGIVVREIAALGGIMGEIADQSILQMKLLNTKKGPGVRSLRSQIDKEVYKKQMLSYLKTLTNLVIIEDLVIDIVVEQKTVIGVICEQKHSIFSDIVILTTGTYLNSRVLIGSEIKIEGPHGERTDHRLSDALINCGFKLQRLKTGTPPRISKSSIDFNLVSEECGDKEHYTFSFNKKPKYLVNPQLPCYLTYTTEETKQLIQKNLNLSSMYGGINEKLGIGPRYCPSIEDKITRFSDKERHQLFLEPESLSNDDIYIQGFSSSMPEYIQQSMVQSVIGLEQAIIRKYAYAIEYDALDPLILKTNLETKLIKNLFTAGQINGTSGYEEAAGQGLIAGMNAVLKLNNQFPIVLGRDQAYIGVLIDDLVTKGTREPYRLLTSRAEYRLILRSDNADLRLSKLSYEKGFLSKEEFDQLILKEQQIEELTNLLDKTIITKNKETNYQLARVGLPEIKEKTSLKNFLKRPEVNLVQLIAIFCLGSYSKEVIDQVSINIKYSGYFEKLKKDIARIKKHEKTSLKTINDYNSIKNLASEAVQKLNIVKPDNLGQASRISGVNPADISMLLIHLKRGDRP